MSSSKTFEALSCLQDYADASDRAHKELKSCLWQLTKSRRNARSGIIGVDSTTAYTAEMLREELRAQTRVVRVRGDGTSGGGDVVVAALVDEDGGDGSAATTTPTGNQHDSGSKASSPPVTWKAQCVLESSSAAPTEDETPSSLESKIANTDDSSTRRPFTDDDEYYDREEEERLLRTDPLKLFGGYFTARELKVAQRNAKQALDGYIQAANEAAKLLELLREKQQ